MPSLLSRWKDGLSVWEILCSFLNFLFDVFSNDTYLTYSFDKRSC